MSMRPRSRVGGFLPPLGEGASLPMMCRGADDADELRCAAMAPVMHITFRLCLYGDFALSECRFRLTGLYTYELIKQRAFAAGGSK
jgi:hypothetical protein